MALLHPDPEYPTHTVQPVQRGPANGSVSLTDRLMKRFIGREERVGDPARPAPFPPRPTQLSLPLEAHDADTPFAMPSLFRGARRIGPVLSYEQASLDRIIPDAATPAEGHESLILPGGVGLILHDGGDGTLAFDWMRWGGTDGRDGADVGFPFEPTLSLAELRKNGRNARRLAKRRCIVPLTRYSVPVRDGDIWTHRWISPENGQIACAAGIWVAQGDESPRFVMVTHDPGSPCDAEPGGPLLLAESDLLPWLRASLKDMLARIGQASAR